MRTNLRFPPSPSLLQSLERAEEERGKLSSTCDSLQEEQQRLQAAVAALEAAQESAVGAATAGLFAEHMQQMGELQTALEEARKEHAKAGEWHLPGKRSVFALARKNTECTRGGKGESTSRC